MTRCPGHWDGSHCSECWADMREALSTLAHNLAIAGGLCEAFELGTRYSDEWLKRQPFYPHWHPGIGHAARKIDVTWPEDATLVTIASKATP